MVFSHKYTWNTMNVTYAYLKKKIHGADFSNRNQHGPPKVVNEGMMKECVRISQQSRVVVLIQEILKIHHAVTEI